MVDEESIRTKYMESQILEQQIKQINQQLINLNNQLVELQRISEVLDTLSKTKENSELLVAIGGGMFSKAELKDSNKVLVNVGADVILEKDIPSSKEIVLHQMEEIKKVIAELEQEFQILAANNQMIANDLQNLVSQMKNNNS